MSVEGREIKDVYLLTVLGVVAILAGMFDKLSTAAFIVNFALLQVSGCRSTC